MVANTVTRKEIVDLFLCHNGADKDWTRRLGEHIESETFDGSTAGRPLRVWFDEWDIDAGQNVIVQINRGLAVARYVAVVISPEFLDAPWPTFEWTHVIAEDPVNRAGRMIPLFHRDQSPERAEPISLPAPFKVLNWIDFRRPREFKRSYQKLIRRLRDQPPERGTRRRPMAAARPGRASALPLSAEQSAAPDRVSEVVLGDLLPVESYPTTIWSAPTEARRATDIYASAPEAGAFELQEKRLFSFCDLSAPEEPLRAAIDTGAIRSERVASWRGDEVRWRWLMSLMGRCLRRHLRGLPLAADRRDRYFFVPNEDGTSRTWQNKGDPAREVAARKSGAAFWVHHGAALRFQALGDRLFLGIDPCYVFTLDGHRPLEGPKVGPLSMQWSGKERNAAILRHVVFWARTLGRGAAKIKIATGAAPIVVSGIPALAKTSHGIEFDHIGLKSLMAQVEDELTQVAQAVTFDPPGDDPDNEQEGDDEP